MTIAAQAQRTDDDDLTTGGELTRCNAVCETCALFRLNLCAGEGLAVPQGIERRVGDAFPISTCHTIPARRTICHPKEWSEFVHVICRGWSAAPDPQHRCERTS